MIYILFALFGNFSLVPLVFHLGQNRKLTNALRVNKSSSYYYYHQNSEEKEYFIKHFVVFYSFFQRQ